MPSAFEDWTGKARSVKLEDEIARRGIKLSGAVDRCGPCPKCGGEDRFSINIQKQVFNCRGCDKGGDVIALVEHLDSCDFVAACTTLTGQPPPKPNGKDRNAGPRKVVAAEYRYEDEHGALAFVVERIEYQKADGTFVTKDGKRKKTFRQRRPDAEHPGEWLWNVDGVPVIPYRLPGLIEAVAAGHAIVIVEGETKVDLLGSWNVPATCCAGGAKKWRTEHTEYLRGADVVLVPDNDDAGWAHVNEVGAALMTIAARVRVLVLPDLPPKGDIKEWAAAGGTRERLDALVEQAPEWQPPTVEEAKTSHEKDKATAKEDALLEALLKMPKGIEFTRERARLAREIGVPKGTIDDELEARRSGERSTAPLYGHWIVEPWPEPVEGDSLLRDIIARVRRHIVCTHDDALAVALWVMFAWVHNAVAVHSPILDVTSAEPECGKTTTLSLTSFLIPRCISTVEVSEAALYRSMQLWEPSFAIDEFDTVLSGTDDKAKALRSVINSGHTRGQCILRCQEPDFMPTLFPTFAPKAIGMVGRKLPAATLSRCIIVELRRRKATERIERFEHKDDAGLGELRSRLLRWSIDNEDVLRDAQPHMPDAFDNRRADNWRLLFAIADLAGGEWGDKARAAASNIERASDTSSIGVRLLAHIKRIFDELGCDVILSAVLVAKLKEDAEQPWDEWNNGKGLTQNSLAVLLGGGGGRGRGSRGGYGVRSQNVVPATGVQGKGYKRSQFEDAWERYLTAEIPSSSDEAGQ